MITFFPSAHFLNISFNLNLTSFIEETNDTILATSFSLILVVTSLPFKYTISFELSVSNSISISSNKFIIFSFSSNSIFLFIVSKATHLYADPDPILTSPNFFATSSVTVPFPLPAGPSIATIKLIFYSPISSSFCGT